MFAVIFLSDFLSKMPSREIILATERWIKLILSSASAVRHSARGFRPWKTELDTKQKLFISLYTMLHNFSNITCGHIPAQLHPALKAKLCLKISWWSRTWTTIPCTCRCPSFTFRPSYLKWQWPWEAEWESETSRDSTRGYCSDEQMSSGETWLSLHLGNC